LEINYKMKIQIARIKPGQLTEDSRFAPYVGDLVTIIEESVVVNGEEIHSDFDMDFYSDIFEIIKEEEV